MSVINTMLKDLENRGGVNEAEREPVLQGLGSRNGPAPRRHSAVPIVAAGVASTVALLLAAYLVSPYRLVPDARPSITPQAQASLQDPEPVAPEEIAPVTTARPGAVAEAGLQSPLPAVAAVQQEQQPAQPAVVAAAPAQKASAKVETKSANTAQADEVHQDQKPAAETANTKPATEAVAVQPVRLASTAATSAIVMQGEDEEESTDLLDTKKQRALTGTEQSTQTYAIALKHYRKGDRQQAKILLREALNHDSANVAARRLLAGIHLEAGQPEIARETVEAGLRKSGNDEDLLRLYLQANVKLGDYARAISVMQQLRPATPEEFGYLAGLYQKNKDHINAVSYYSQALQIKPNQSVWWMGQGISLEALGKYNEALQSYSQSVKAGRLTAQLTDFVANRIITIERKLEPQDS